MFHKLACRDERVKFKAAARDVGKQQSATVSPKNYLGIIIGITSGIVLVACIVAAALTIRNRRRKYNAHRRLISASVGAHPDGTSLEDDDENLPGLVCGPGQKSAINVVHADRTDTIVPAQLTKQEQNALIQTLGRDLHVKAVLRSKRRPKITRVITYGTSDDITRIDKSSCEETSNSKEEVMPVMFGESLLIKLIRNGPKRFPFDFDELRDLLICGARVFINEPTLLEIPVPCVVYGDIHGQYSDLHRWFNLNGWPSQVRSVFLGDFVDRGSHGIEVVALLIALKISFPSNIFLCRGNHEEESLNRAYSFHEEVCSRFPEQKSKDGKDGKTLYVYFKKMFDNMPLAVLIGGRILGMHGGISPHLNSLQAIRDIRRPLEEFDVGTLACDLVWSDPDTNPERSGFRVNLEREPNYGIGQLFASDAVQSVCQTLGIDMIIRGHQAPLHGYALFSGGCMVTLFSAPGYKGVAENEINMGATLDISSNMNITIKQIRVSETFRQRRITDVDQRRRRTSSNCSIPLASPPTATVSPPVVMVASLPPTTSKFH